MLIAMLVTWVTVGSPHYASMDDGQNIAYVSFWTDFSPVLSLPAPAIVVLDN